MSKITRTTIKSFIRKNQGNLFIKTKAEFNGMIDGISYAQNAQFVPATATEWNVDRTLGISGLTVLSGNNLFQAIKYDGFEGFEIYNCCGTFEIAIKTDAK